MTMENIWQNILSTNALGEIEKQDINVIYFSYDSPMNRSTFNELLSFLPLHLQLKVKKYRKFNDQQNCLLGKVMIYLGYYHTTGKELDFNSLVYKKSKKPYILDSEMEFNISHSENTVICGYGKQDLGIDLEKVQNIDLSGFKDVFTSTELLEIKKKGNEKFYELWTKKEAFSKAVGKGLSINLKHIKVEEEKIIFENETWNVNHFKLKDNLCSLVFKYPINKLNITSLKI